MSDGGKGSAARPFSVPRDQYRSNWDLIFGKKTKDEKKPCGNCEKCKCPDKDTK